MISDQTGGKEVNLIRGFLHLERVEIVAAIVGLCKEDLSMMAALTDVLGTMRHPRVWG